MLLHKMQSLPNNKISTTASLLQAVTSVHKRSKTLIHGLQQCITTLLAMPELAFLPANNCVIQQSTTQTTHMSTKATILTDMTLSPKLRTCLNQCAIGRIDLDLIISNDYDSVISLVGVCLLWFGSQPHETCLSNVTNSSLLLSARQLTDLSKGLRLLCGSMIP